MQDACLAAETSELHGRRTRFTEVHNPRQNRSTLREGPVRAMGPRARLRDSEKVSREKWGRRVGEWVNGRPGDVNSRFPLQLPASPRARRAPCAPSPAEAGTKALDQANPPWFSSAISHLGGFQIPPRSTLSVDWRQRWEEKAPRRATGALSAHKGEPAARPHPHGNAPKRRFERPRRRPRAGSPTPSTNEHRRNAWTWTAFSSRRPIGNPMKQWA